MLSPDNLWDMILTLATAAELTRELVEKTTGAVLVPDMSKSNAFFDVYHAASPDDDDVLAEAELRTPKEGAAAKGPLLVLKVRDPGEIDANFVHAKMNRPPRPIFPSPRQKEGALVYHEYETRAGKIKFGFTHDAEQRFSAVVLDRTET